MVLLPIYALIVWFFCLRFRRRWIGYACAVGGALSVLLVIPLVAWVLGVIGVKSDPGIFTFLILAESTIVLLIGVFVASLPRRDRVNRCDYCDYDLSGHSAEQPPVCPECGVPFDGYASKRKRYVSSTEVREALAARQEALRCEFTDPERSAEITRRISALIDAKATDPDAPPRSTKPNPTEPGPA
ncbi:MAG: hypothetical protein K2X32_06620 [Phycisphaerales bacterium]|nr:hypothetical protein [Phycisphaerales bacterium]